MRSQMVVGSGHCWRLICCAHKDRQVAVPIHIAASDCPEVPGCGHRDFVLAANHPFRLPPQSLPPLHVFAFERELPFRWRLVGGGAHRHVFPVLRKVVELCLVYFLQKSDALRPFGVVGQVDETGNGRRYYHSHQDHHAGTPPGQGRAVPFPPLLIIRFCGHGQLSALIQG